MNDQKNVKGNPSYLNTNKEKTEENHPDFRGSLTLTEQQLAALVAIYERASKANAEPILQVDIAGWKRISRNDEQPYLYITNEVYTGERKPRNTTTTGFNNNSFRDNKEKPKKESSDWF
jgi:hypothetical protein